MSAEPILRHIEYSFLGEGFATVIEQFMLGEKYLVVSVVDNKLEKEVNYQKALSGKTI